MIDLVLKKSKERSLLRRHPWVYDTAVQKVVLDSKKTAPASGCLLYTSPSPRDTR